MTKYAYFVLLCLITSWSFAGSNRDKSEGGLNASPALDDQIYAQGTIGRGAESGSLFIRDGGQDIRLAVLKPDTLGDVPDYIPGYIQGMLNNNINKFSAIMRMTPGAVSHSFR